MNISTNQLGSQPMMPDVLTYRRTNRIAAVTSTQQLPRQRSPEHKLWTSILAAIYRDVAREGPFWTSYRDAIRSRAELEEVASGLGWPSGAIDRLLAAAVKEWRAARKMAGGEEA